MKEEGPLFSDKIKDLPKWSPQNEGMLEEVILFFSKCMIDLKDLKTELRKTETEFKVFQNKVRHPFRTILKRIFR